MQSIENIARSYWKAEENRDIRAILEHFSPDATWLGPGGIELHGHDEIRRYYEDTSRDFPGLEVEVEVTGVVGDDHAAALEWRAILTDREGTRHPCSGVNVMEGDGDRITSLHAYYDRVEIALRVGHGD